MRSRTLLVSGLLVALLIAGVASFYASQHPDGLISVAEKTGFVGAGRDSATAEGPLAGYRTRGVDDARISGGLAGVAGALVVLVIAGGLTWSLRRRRVGDGDPELAECDRENA